MMTRSAWGMVCPFPGNRRVCRSPPLTLSPEITNWTN